MYNFATGGSKKYSSSSSTYSKQYSKQSSSNNIMIKNDNLKFNSSTYEIFFYPFHPQVIKKSSSSYQINKNSVVAAFTFIPKIQQNQQNNDANNQNMNNKSKSWQQRKSISFKFNQLARFIQINPFAQGSKDKIWKVRTQRGTKNDTTYIKQLIIKNNHKQNLIDITFEQSTLQQISKNPQIQWRINTKIQYTEFNILTHLIKESLFDLSGMKLLFDLRRNQQLAKLSIKQRSQIQKEDLFKSYDNKDSVV